MDFWDMKRPLTALIKKNSLETDESLWDTTKVHILSKGDI